MGKYAFWLCVGVDMVILQWDGPYFCLHTRLRRLKIPTFQIHRFKRTKNIFEPFFVVSKGQQKYIQNTRRLSSSFDQNLIVMLIGYNL